jgi:hypothetical protein
MATVPWFKATLGLYNKADPGRHQYSEKTGVTDLAEAYNVVYGDTGDISRRLGFTATDITTECHSLFCEDGVCLFVTGDALCILDGALAFARLRNVSVGARMSYAQIADSVFYMNGRESGIVTGGRSMVWAAPTSVKMPGTTRNYSNPPIGTIVRAFAARLWIAKDNVLWYSEPFQYSLYNLARGYVPFAAKLIMVAPTLDGIYVSTAQAIYYLGGTDPQKFNVVRVSNYPAIAGTDTTVDGIVMAGGKLSPHLVPIWTTTEGICVGLPGGNMMNLTYEKLSYPRSTVGCALYTGKEYIVNLEP